MNTNNLLIDFITEFDATANLGDCFAVLEKAVEKLGFSAIAYTLIPVGLNALESNNPIFLASANFSKDFLGHYAGENFAADDFTIKRILNGNLKPMDWWQEERKGLLLEREKRVIQTAKTDYAINNGLSIPMLSSPQHIAGASIISEENGAHFGLLLEERLALLRAIITLFHHRVYGNFEYRKAFYSAIVNKLTDREKRVLQFLVIGQPYKAMDNRYGMSASAAANARSDLFRKFAVKNASELAYLAGLHNLIEML